MFLYHYHEGRYETALEEALKVETEDYRTPMFLAAVYGQLGRMDQAQRELSRTRAMWSASTDGYTDEAHAYIERAAAHFEDALAAFQDVKAGRPVTES